MGVAPAAGALSTPLGRMAVDRRSLVLRDHADGSCEMLGEDGLCRVHAAKPAQCREFPFSWRNPDSFRTCPGLRALAEGGGASYRRRTEWTRPRRARVETVNVPP